MKPHRLIAAGASLATTILSFAFPVGAQQQPATRPAATPAARAATPTASGTVAIADAKIVIINTAAFDDEKEGITKLVNAMKGVDREFQPRRTELQGIQTRMNSIAEQIEKTKAVATPQSIQVLVDQADTLKRELERKGQDAQRDYNKRMQEIIAPVYDELGKALDTYAKQRGITLIIDASKIPGAIFVTNDQLDITREFITDYNRRNPATASAASPAR